MTTILLNPCGGSSCTCTGQIGRAYIGGDFTSIGGAAKDTCAMLDGDGVAVDTFTCTPDDSVVALYLDETNATLWIGGFFLTVNGSTTKALAGVDWNTGAMVYSYNIVGDVSNVLHDSFITSFASDGTYLYFGGELRTIGGVTGFFHVARLLLSSGVVDTSWKPVFNGGVSGLSLLESTTLYAATSANTVNATATHGAFSIDVANPTAAPAWNAVWNSGGPLSILAVSSSSIFVGGTLAINGPPLKSGLIEYDATGASTSWYPTPGTNLLQGGASPSANRLVPFRTTGLAGLLVGGDFTSAAGVSIGNIASFLFVGQLDESFDHTTPSTSSLTSCSDATYAGDGRVYAAFSGNGKGVYAYEADDGSTFDGWAPASNGDCFAIITTMTPP